MKKIIYTFIYTVAIVIIIDLISCNKSKSKPDCGCNSAAIESAQEWKGYLFFDSSQKRFKIQIGVPGLYSNYFICDTTFPELHSIIDSNRILKYYVLFSGNATKFCVPDTIVGYIDKVYNISLTNLKKIN